MPRRMSPTDPMFCAKRAWDQRAESGYMRQIEDEFQVVADEIIAGRRSLDPARQVAVSYFFSLWYQRALHRANPVADQPLRGITPVQVTEDQRECLEKKGYIVNDPAGFLPGRMLAGVVIQRDIDRMATRLEEHSWGVLVAQAGEFIVPDFFGDAPIVPVTSTICLLAGSGDTTLLIDGVRELNQLAIKYAQEYLVARDFSRCPT